MQPAEAHKRLRGLHGGLDEHLEAPSTSTDTQGGGGAGGRGGRGGGGFGLVETKFSC
jgi:hypothetical protein